VIFDNRDNLNLKHIKPFLEQNSFMSTVVHSKFFNHEILKNIKECSYNTGINFNHTILNNLVAKTLFPSGFCKDGHPSLSTTLKEGFSAVSLRIKLDINNIYRVGVKGSKLDIFLEENNSLHLGDIYLPQYGTSSRSIINNIQDKYTALNNETSIMNSIEIIKQRCLDAGVMDDKHRCFKFCIRWWVYYQCYF